MALGSRSSPSASPVDDQAAAWFARRRTGIWSNEDERAFAAWLRADPSHSAAWASYTALWERLDSVRDDPEVLELRELARRNAVRRNILRRTGWVGGVLAASLVLAFPGGWLVRHHGGMFTGPVGIPAQNRPGSAVNRDLVTQVGQRSTVVLPDGSKIMLNTASAAHVDFTIRERRITLVRGEAFFEVAKDVTRPFVVRADSRRIIAVGTAFDVRMDEDRVAVALVEGRVKIVRAGLANAQNIAATVPPVLLEAGSELISSEKGPDQILTLDAGHATSWTTGRLIFQDETLSHVIAEMNRYAHEQLEIADAALGKKKISGVFEPTGGAAFAKALEEYGIARITQMTPTKIVLTSPQTNSHP